MYVRDRRNRDRDNRRLWGDLRRSRPSRKEEGEWTIIAPATSTLNVGEVDLLFTEVRGKVNFTKFGFRNVNILPNLADAKQHSADVMHSTQHYILWCWMIMPLRA